MKVTFCVRDDKSNYRVTAYGNLLGLDEGDEIGSHTGRVLSFTIDREFGDTGPFAERFPAGIVSAAEKREFYQFEVLSGSGQTGILKIIQSTREERCLPADAP